MTKSKMSSDKGNELISVADPHTIKKFELISEYVVAWSQVLMNFDKCTGIVYIDCMSNSGKYKDNNGNDVDGTALRVANILADTMKNYPSKQAYLYFNDKDAAKIELLGTLLPKQTHNFHVELESRDASDLLNSISKEFFSQFQNMNFLLLYDPYVADIDWDALMPYLQHWGEVILTHMVSDPIRAVKVASRPATIDKYERTYQTSIDELIACGSDRKAYEEKIEAIIRNLCGRQQKYYVASFPFYNSTNAVIYNLIHCTGHQRGFSLFKATAWKIFGDKSSGKNTHNDENQYTLFSAGGNDFSYGLPSDDTCYRVIDIARYAQEYFKGRTDVPLTEVWEYIDSHPIFPVDGYMTRIKDSLRYNFGATIKKSSITFADRS